MCLCVCAWVCVCVCVGVCVCVCGRATVRRTFSSCAYAYLCHPLPKLLRPEDLVEAVQQTWANFLALYPSKIAAGETIFTAIFDAVPSLQAMFKSPKATTAERFVKGFGEVVRNAGSKSKMMNSIQMMGFRHLEFDINVQRVACASCLAKQLGQHGTTLWFAHLA